MVSLRATALASVTGKCSVPLWWIWSPLKKEAPRYTFTKVERVSRRMLPCLNTTTRAQRC